MAGTGGREFLKDPAVTQEAKANAFNDRKRRGDAERGAHPWAYADRRAGGLLFGYDTAVISGAVAAIDANFITPRGLSETAAGWLSGSTVSCALIGCAVGGLIAGPLSSGSGGAGLLVAAVLFMLSSVGSAYPEIGLGAPGSLGPSALVPFIIYASSVHGHRHGVDAFAAVHRRDRPAAQRGHLVTYQQIAIVGGMTLVYFVNWAIAAQGNDAWILSTGWRYMMLSGVIPAALFFLLLLAVPRHPAGSS